MSDYTDQINVRKVTNIHANWSEAESDTPGKFSFQLLLDDGAEEHVMRPTVDDADVLLKLIGSSDEVIFDQGNGVLSFRSLA